MTANERPVFEFHPVDAGLAISPASRSNDPGAGPAESAYIPSLKFVTCPRRLKVYPDLRYVTGCPALSPNSEAVIGGKRSLAVPVIVVPEINYGHVMLSRGEDKYTVYNMFPMS